MVALFASVSFLLVTAAILEFSSWAEGWLASSTRPGIDRALDPTTSAAGLVSEAESRPDAVPVS